MDTPPEKVIGTGKGDFILFFPKLVEAGTLRVCSGPAGHIAYKVLLGF
jgi:hypothetical protein